MMVTLLSDSRPGELYYVHTFTDKVQLLCLKICHRSHFYFHISPITRVTAWPQGSNTSQPLQATATLQTAAPATAAMSSVPADNSCQFSQDKLRHKPGLSLTNDLHYYKKW